MLSNYFFVIIPIIFNLDFSVVNILYDFVYQSNLILVIKSCNFFLNMVE